MWAENRRQLKSASHRRITQELKVKRVSEDIIRSVLEADDHDDISMLGELVVRKRRQTRYQDDQKLLAYLIRQGYNYQDVKLALNLYLAGWALNSGAGSSTFSTASWTIISLLVISITWLRSILSVPPMKFLTSD